MARASAAIGDIEAGADLGYEADDEDYSYGYASQSPGFDKGTVGRRALILWGASAVWLLLVWRAVEGY